MLKKSRIVEIGKQIPSDNCYGEFIGIAMFSKYDNNLFFQILDECVRDKSTWRYYFEYAANLLCKEHVLTAVDISDLPATEIDFLEDLEFARNSILPQLQQLRKSAVVPIVWTLGGPG